MVVTDFLLENIEETAADGEDKPTTNYCGCISSLICALSNQGLR